MPNLYWAPIEKRYYAPICSCVGITYIALFLFTIIIPFVIVYESGNLWTKTSQYYEQASVDFRSEIMISVLDSQGSHTYSTIKSIYDEQEHSLGVPLIKVKKYDTNSDGLLDSLHLNIQFKSAGGTTDVKNVQVLTTFNYGLQDRLSEEMIGLLYASADTPDGASRVLFDGSLELVQTSPVLIDSKTRTLYNSNPLSEASFES